MKLRGVVVVENGVPSRVSQGWLRVPALEQVANRPILEHVLDSLQVAGIEEIVVVTPGGLIGTVRDRLDARGDVAIRYVEHDAPVDLAAAIRLTAPIVGDAPCVVHRAAGLLDEPLARFITRLRDAPDALLIVHQASSPDEHLSPATQDMLHLAEFNADHALGMAGVWVFGPGAMPIVASWRWPISGDVDLTWLGARISAAGGTFNVELADSWRQYRGCPLELLELNRIVLDRLEIGVRRPSNNGNRFEGRVWIHEAANVRDSVIVGPTVIGLGARIEDSYIGPYTSIGERARVEGAEVERSIISAGASVQHVGGRLVSSVVGRDARVFRDFSLPRAFRLRVGEGTEVALC
jgi:glucose-1-phosphate thymidylyltransferase